VSLTYLQYEYGRSCFYNFSVANCASLIFFLNHMYEGSACNTSAIFISVCILRHFFLEQWLLCLLKLYFRFSTLDS
jgi:hypothetical protein